MPRSANPAEPRLRDFLRELATGGVVLCDPLAEVSGVDGSSSASDPPGELADQVAFRTLIQLDGDICLSVHAQALRSPDFAAAYARHVARVQQIVHGRMTQVRRSIKGIGWIAGLLSGGLVLTSESGYELAEGLIPEGLIPTVYADLGVIAAAGVAALLMSRLGHILARQLLKR